jgi:uncharacterized cupredoxin-like copper-binding protein
MKTSARLALGAVLVLALAGCAGSSGQPWTPPPAGTPAAESAAPESAAPESAAPATAAPESAAPSAAPESAAPASVAPSAAPESAAPGSAAPSAAASEAPGEARVIELEMDAALRILQDGVQVKDIPVTPGETIKFIITNTAGYVHNFWIGPDQALMTNQTTGLVGIPDWTDSAPRELEWVVPDDITGLKYGCTVPGHYMLMQGTFSPAS